MSSIQPQQPATTYSPKSLEQYQREYFAALANAGSGLAFDTTQGSVLYALARGSAAVASTQAVDLRRLADSITLAGAKGADLDAYSSYGISRQLARPATGTVLAILTSAPSGQQGDRPVVVVPNTVLTEVQSTIQFRTTNTAPIRVGYLETLLPIESTEPTNYANLQAGTRLYSSRYGQLQFVVGHTHTAANTYHGDLTGGRLRESDDAYRARIANWLAARSTTARENVMQRLLAFPGVVAAHTRTTAGGVLELWVDLATPDGQASTTMNPTQKQELSNWVRPYVSDGIFISVGQIQRRYVDLRFDVQPFYRSNLDQLSARIRELCGAYFNQQRLAQDLRIEPLLTLLRPLATKVRLVSPRQDVFVGNEQRAMLGSVDVNYQIY